MIGEEVNIYILTEENTVYNLDCIPDTTEDDIRYCVWDCSNIKYTDFYWLPLIFLESFSAPAVVLQVGNNTIQMPLDWSIMVCDEHMSSLEVMPLVDLNDRGFHTILFNPLSNNIPKTEEVVITDVYADVKWYFPKLKNSNLLVHPLDSKNNPWCSLFVKEGNKVPDPIDVGLLFE